MKGVLISIARSRAFRWMVLSIWLQFLLGMVGVLGYFIFVVGWTVWGIFAIDLLSDYPAVERALFVAYLTVPIVILVPMIYYVGRTPMRSIPLMRKLYGLHRR